MDHEFEGLAGSLLRGLCGQKSLLVKLDKKALEFGHLGAALAHS
jgi:hypothetical protein